MTTGNLDLETRLKQYVRLLDSHMEERKRKFMADSCRTEIGVISDSEFYKITHSYEKAFYEKAKQFLSIVFPEIERS